jgi:hypothetical protein
MRNMGLDRGVRTVHRKIILKRNEMRCEAVDRINVTQENKNDGAVGYTQKSKQDYKDVCTGLCYLILSVFR